MRTTIVTMAVLALAVSSMPGAAFGAQGTYRIRNASQTVLRCAIEVTRGGRRWAATIPPGRIYLQRLEGDGERALSCSTNRFNRTNFRVRAGILYELIETSSGDIRLRTVDS
ncbi:MAG TPA: hypothetical protein VEC11_13795 [Allosphingosinicella sp.]|nr:hypothetical protein [Allosphingosinicella sp.]